MFNLALVLEQKKPTKTCFSGAFYFITTTNTSRSSTRRDLQHQLSSQADSAAILSPIYKMVSLPVVPTYYDENVGPDVEFSIFLKKLCSEIDLAYNSKECQQVAVFTQPQPKGSIYARGLYQWRREEAEDLQVAAQKMAGDDYVVKVEKAGPDTRTPAQRAWDSYGLAMIFGPFVFVALIAACLRSCGVCCQASAAERPKRAKKARNQRDTEDRRERKEPRSGHFRKKSRTSTLGDIELGIAGQVLIGLQRDDILILISIGLYTAGTYGRR